MTENSRGLAAEEREFHGLCKVGEAVLNIIGLKYQFADGFTDEKKNRRWEN